MCKRLLLSLAICLVAESGFAQSPLNGKWPSARPADPIMMTEAQRKQSVRLELAIEGNIASGTLTIGGLGGSFYTFKDGKVSGNRVQVACR